MQAAITVRQLTKTYAEGEASVVALRGVDLEVHAGEIVMLMGPSGSGKTTLLSIMGCILTATTGSVQVAGREVDEEHPQEPSRPGRERPDGGQPGRRRRLPEEDRVRKAREVRHCHREGTSPPTYEEEPKTALPEGKLLRSSGRNAQSPIGADELTTDIEDAWLLSL